MESKKNIELIFSKLQELKQLTTNQRKVLIAEDLDAYLSIEKIRASLREEINEIKRDIVFGREEYKFYMVSLKEMLKLEKDNQRLILEWKSKAEEDENKLRNIRKLSTAYFNADSVSGNPKHINRIT
jgi:hypothetical protein